MMLSYICNSKKQNRSYEAVIKRFINEKLMKIHLEIGLFQVFNFFEKIDFIFDYFQFFAYFFLLKAKVFLCNFLLNKKKTFNYF